MAVGRGEGAWDRERGGGEEGPGVGNRSDGVIINYFIDISLR